MTVLKKTNAIEVLLTEETDIINLRNFFVKFKANSKDAGITINEEQKTALTELINYIDPQFKDEDHFEIRAEVLGIKFIIKRRRLEALNSFIKSITSLQFGSLQVTEEEKQIALDVMVNE